MYGEREKGIRGKQRQHINDGKIEFYDKVVAKG